MNILHFGILCSFTDINKEIIEEWKAEKGKVIETKAIKELSRLVKEENIEAVIGPSCCV